MNDKTLLSVINNKLATLNSRQALTELPKVPSHLQNKFKDSKILMVDDSLEWIEFWLPKIILISSEKSDALRHKADLDLEGLHEEIKSQQPEIILLDYYLAGKIRGTSVLAELLKSGTGIKVIGFSSVASGNQELLRAGAVAVADKANPDCNYVLAEIASAIEQFN